MADQQRRRLLQTAAWGGATLLAGCGGGGTEPTPATSRGEDAAPGVFTTTTITLQRDQAAAPLNSRFAGLSYEKDKLTQPLFVADNESLIALYRLLGPGVMRIGANAVDKCSWEGATQGLTILLPAHIKGLAAFLQATDWQVIYGVNLADNSPAQAAAEAAYVASRLGNRLLAFEIGNEPDLYHSNGYRPSHWAFGDFLGEWHAMAAAIAAAVPGAVFSGPATASNVVGFTEPFAHAAVAHNRMLTQHYYRANGRDAASTLALLLRPDPKLPSELGQLTLAATSNHLPLGWRMDECNSFYNGGTPNVSDAYGTALWALDFLFVCALGGCSGVNFHGGGHGPGYTPIADSSGVITEVRPVFYGMLLFSLAAQGSPVPASVVGAGNTNVTAYGVIRGDGGVNVVVINKDPTLSIDTSIGLGQPASGLNALWLSGRSLAATSGQLLGGAAVNASGGWAPQTRARVGVQGMTARLTVPPASAVLLQS